LHILLVTARYPWPPRRGDQLRACQMLELLAPEHHVTLLAPEPSPPSRPSRPRWPRLPARQTSPGAVPPTPLLPPGTTLRTYRAPRGRTGAVAGLARAAVRGMPLQSGLSFAPDLGRQLRQLAPHADLVVLQLVRLAVHREDVGPTPLLVDLVDDLALNFAQRAAVDRPWLRPMLALEARLLARAQRWLAGEASSLLVVCDRDRNELLRRLSSPAARPALAARVATVGLAVEPAPGPGPPPAVAAAGPPAGGEEVPPRLVFTGNLGYFVNADAIEWWLGRVWPALAARRPDLRLVVAGDRPRPRVRRAVARAAGGSGAVELLESVPDLRPVLAGAAAALAPMRCGSGVPVKILEAWSQGVPVVASPWAAAGTSGVPGKDLLVAESPSQWVETLANLLEDPRARQSLAASGHQRLLADYSRQHIKQQLLAAVASAVPD
jgi:glycosyltransferase involved in cell wall biosynthesis